MCDNSRTTNLLSKFIDKGEVLTSKIKKFYFLSHDLEVERDLRVTISVVIGDKVVEQKIVIQITNDSNPVFLFTLSITKQDFETLKSDQGINVDFKDFPAALVNLLDKSTHNGKKGVFKLMLVDYCGTVDGSCLMDMNKIQIKIIEECEFKNICHLTLSVTRGTELQIRQKLEAELYKIKNELSHESKRHDEALQKVSDLVEELKEKTEIIENLEMRIDDINRKWEDSNCKERALHETRIKELEKEYDNKLVTEREQCQKETDRVILEKKDIERQLKVINEKQQETQLLVFESEKETELIKKELISVRQDYYTLKDSNSKLLHNFQEKEKTVNTLRTRLVLSEQELKNSCEKIDGLEDFITNLKSENKTLIQTNEQLKNTNRQLELHNSKLSEDLNKANDIIAKKAIKMQTYLDKLKLNSYTFTRQEKQLQEKDDKMLVLKNDIKKLQDQLTEADENITDLRNVMIDVEVELNNKNEQLRAKSQLFNLLRENLLENKVDHMYNFSQKSLLQYRAFLSMPSLLPSDETRRLEELCYPLDYETYLWMEHQNKPGKKQRFKSKKSESGNMIKDYLFRYFRRFSNVSFSLFKTCDVPISMLAPRGLLSQTTTNDSVNHVRSSIKNTEYSSYTIPSFNHSTAKFHSDPLMSNSGGTYNVEEKSNSRSTQVNNHLFSKYNKSKNFGLEDDKTEYASVAGFRLRPRGTNKGELPSCKTVDPNSLRNSPAIPAPPLLPKQRETKNQSTGPLKSVFVLKSTPRAVPNFDNQYKNNKNESTAKFIPFRKSELKNFRLKSVVQKSAHNLENIEECIDEPSAYFVP